MRPMSVARITWRQVQEQTPEDGKRREAIGGELYVTAAPNVRHQEVSKRLERALYGLLEDPGLGTVYHAPIGVEFPATGEGVQPDIVFVSRERKGVVTPEWVNGAPDLVVEILSPTTEARDRGLKRDLYERRGVRQYWIVDPEADAVEVWTFDGEAKATSREQFSATLPVRLRGDVVGQIDLGQVFAREG